MILVLEQRFDNGIHWVSRARRKWWLALTLIQNPSLRCRALCVSHGPYGPEAPARPALNLFFWQAPLLPLPGPVSPPARPPPPSPLPGDRERRAPGHVPMRQAPVGLPVCVRHKCRLKRRATGRLKAEGNQQVAGRP